MFRTFALSVLMLSSSLAMPSLLRAQRIPSTGHTGGVIDVQVRYADGRPGPRDIHVRLEAAEGGPVGDCETREGGKCQFSLPTSGVYILRLANLGFQETSARVELIGATRGYAVLILKPVLGEAKPEPTSMEKGDSVSVGSLAIPPNAKQEFDKGEEALKASQPDEAVNHLQKAIKLYDNYPDAYRLLGDAYLQSHDLKNAETALKKSIELEPKIAAAHIDLGAVQNQLKDYPGAETSLKQGLELSPDAAGAKYELAKTYWAMGRWDDAAPFAQQAVVALPTLASARVLFGNILLKQRNAAGALEQYQEYLRLEPNGAMAPSVQELVNKIQKALQK